MPTQQQIEHYLAMFTAIGVPTLGLLGALLPADNRLGQWIRQWFPDPRNRNLTMPPPATTPAKEEAAK